MNTAFAQIRCSLEIQEAANHGNINQLSKLIGKGENINCLGEWDQTLLIKTIQSGHPEAAIYLINQGANTSIPDDEGGLAIHRSAMMGQQDVFAMLVEKSNLNIKDGRGMTPLMWASNRNHLSLVRDIVSQGADLNIQCDSGYTALTYTSSPQIAEYLLKSGSNPDLRDYRGFNAIENANEHIERAKNYDKELVEKYHKIIEILSNG